MRTSLGLKGLVGLVLATALAASAATVTLALPFSDTGSSPFADEIDEITDSGCASGFPNGTFAPQDNVKRQQFAYWMANCGGRVEYAENDGTLTTGGSTQIVALNDSITTAGATGSGQTQYLWIQGIVEVGSEALVFDDFCQSAVSCPFDAEIYVGATEVAHQTAQWITPSPGEYQLLTVQAVVPVATGTTTNYSIRVTPGAFEASQAKVRNRSLTAMVLPFSNTTFS